MARKKHSPEEIVTKLRQVDVLTGQGNTVAAAVRTIGVTEFTYYRWRKEYGGLKGDQVKRLMQAAGRDPNLYGAHSLRIGGATAALAAGVTPAMIRMMGRW